MRKMLRKVVTRYGKHICSLAGFAAMVSVYSCRGMFYQPEEPEGLKELAERTVKSKK